MFLFRALACVGLGLTTARVAWKGFTSACIAIIHASNAALGGALGASRFILRTPGVVRLLVVPSRSRPYAGPPTAWQRLLHAATHPSTLLSALHLLSPQQRQFMSSYALLLLPASTMAAVSLLSLLHRINVLRPMLSGAWKARGTVAASALAGVSAALVDHTLRYHLFRGRYWTALACGYSSVALAAAAVKVATSPSDGEGRRRLRVLLLRTLHVAAAAHCSITSLLLLLEATAGAAPVAATTSSSSSVAAPETVASPTSWGQPHDCMAWSVLTALLSVESWGLLANMHPLTSLTRAAVHRLGPVKGHVLGALRRLRDASAPALRVTCESAWKGLTVLDQISYHGMQRLGGLLRRWGQALWRGWLAAVNSICAGAEAFWRNAVVPASRALYARALLPTTRAAGAAALFLRLHLVRPTAAALRWLALRLGHLIAATPATLHTYLVLPCTWAHRQLLIPACQAVARGVRTAARAAVHAARACYDGAVIAARALGRAVVWVLRACRDVLIASAKACYRYVMLPLARAAVALYQRLLMPLARAAGHAAAATGRALLHAADLTGSCILAPAGRAVAHATRQAAAALGRWLAAAGRALWAATRTTWAAVSSTFRFVASLLARAYQAVSGWVAAAGELLAQHVLAPAGRAAQRAGRAAARAARTAARRLASSAAWAARHAAHAARSAAHAAAAAADASAQAARRHVAPLAWPVGGGVATAVMLRQAWELRQVVPFALCGYTCGVISLLMVGKSAKGLPLFHSFGSGLERAACVAYLHLDFGLISVASAVVSCVAPLVRSAMAMTRGLISGVFVSVARVADALLSAAALGIARLARAAWEGVLAPALRAVQSGGRSVVVALWSHPELGLAASLACTGLAIWAHRSGAGAVAEALAQHALAQALALLAASRSAAVATYHGVASLLNRGHVAQGAWELLRQVAKGAASGSRGVLEAALGWGNGDVVKVLSQPSFALSLYALQLAQSTSLSRYVLPSVLERQGDTGRRAAVPIVSMVARATLKAALVPLYFAALVSSTFGPGWVSSAAGLIPFGMLLYLTFVWDEAYKRTRPVPETGRLVSRPATGHIWAGAVGGSSQGAPAALGGASHPGAAAAAAAAAGAGRPGAAAAMPVAQAQGVVVQRRATRKRSLQEHVRAQLERGSRRAHREYAAEECTICLTAMDLSRLHGKDVAAAGQLLARGAGSAGAVGDREGGSEACVVVRCGHVYHTECIAEWACRMGSEAAVRASRCPVCRELLFPTFSLSALF